LCSVFVAPQTAMKIDEQRCGRLNKENRDVLEKQEDESGDPTEKLPQNK